MNPLTRFIEKHWKGIVFGLALTIITLGIWLVYKCLSSKES